MDLFEVSNIWTIKTLILCDRREETIVSYAILDTAIFARGSEMMFLILFFIYSHFYSLKTWISMCQIKIKHR